MLSLLLSENQASMLWEPYGVLCFTLLHLESSQEKIAKLYWQMSCYKSIDSAFLTQYYRILKYCRVNLTCDVNCNKCCSHICLNCNMDLAAWSDDYTGNFSRDTSKLKQWSSNAYHALCDCIDPPCTIDNENQPQGNTQATIDASHPLSIAWLNDADRRNHACGFLKKIISRRRSTKYETKQLKKTILY